VFNAGMRLSHKGLLTLLAAVAFATSAAAPSGAKIIEIGSATAPGAPSCPGNPCQAVSRTTGYQAKVGARRQVMAAPADGKIVAWTITLGSPGKAQINYFNDNFGGAASAGISVLKPGKKLRHKVNGHSPIQRLQPYFGTTVQFPLDRTLTVRKGYLVALTVPSWAPALALGQDSGTLWRASRGTNACDKPGQQSAQLALGNQVPYRCLYRTARLTYSVTMITTPTPPKPKG
jgi:hypothetical protein